MNAIENKHLQPHCSTRLPPYHAKAFAMIQL